MSTCSAKMGLLETSQCSKQQSWFSLSATPRTIVLVLKTELPSANDWRLLRPPPPQDESPWTLMTALVRDFPVATRDWREDWPMLALAALLYLSMLETARGKRMPYTPIGSVTEQSWPARITSTAMKTLRTSESSHPKPYGNLSSSLAGNDLCFGSPFSCARLSAATL